MSGSRTSSMVVEDGSQQNHSAHQLPADQTTSRNERYRRFMSDNTMSTPYARIHSQSQTQSPSVNEGGQKHNHHQ
ncbi:hypothetical protein Cob_v005301 [Colletotrichum orbiculare MAFF 240422]|uniref:Uncharacterized protein n=1 Tax=Colletotrichum orbiculare (strain 104-T / ATCC 96160 / CBS 514.97 / LARS 414 / MAFF 240422) TaxID=1213857 RepID=A0A484FU93_COLOR|nr:hypothetical protein Cob_v005301 [Colletotrichum orbiculare MAFF 240422]